MIPYGRQTIDDDDIEAVVQALKSDWLTQGPRVEEFERALAAQCSSNHAVVFSSGSSALQAAYFAAGLKSGDEIIASPITFSATTNAALWFGAKPLFADIEPHSGQMDPAAVEAVATKKTKILAPTDYAGHPAHWDALLSIARRRNWVVVEDACHALGAKSRGRPIGSLADMTVFSFHPVKSITTGEGGAVLTNNPGYAEALARFRHHGIAKDGFDRPSPGSWYHEMQDLGLNGRLTDIQCALGLSQLRKLSGFLAARRAVAERYERAFENLSDLSVVQPTKGDDSAWHLFVILLQGALAERRDEIFNGLREKNIGVQAHYIPVYRHPYYQALGYRQGTCPVAEKFSSRVLSLPIFPTLSIANQTHVIDSLRSIVEECYANCHPA